MEVTGQGGFAHTHSMRCWKVITPTNTKHILASISGAAIIQQRGIDVLLNDVVYRNTWGTSKSSRIHLGDGIYPLDCYSKNGRTSL